MRIHVPSDFSEIILLRMPSAQEDSAKWTPKTPRIQECPQAPSTLSISGSRTAPGPRLLQVWQRVPHFGCRQASRQGSVTQRDVCVLGFVASLLVYWGEKADTIEKELATLLADLGSFLENVVRVLSSPNGHHHSEGGNIPRRAKFGESLVQGSLRRNYSLREKSHSFREDLGRHTHGYRTGGSSNTLPLNDLSLCKVGMVQKTGKS